MGVATSAALLDAAAVALGTPGGGAARLALLMPAGPQDRVLVARRPAASASRPARNRTSRPATVLVAVDLAGRAPEEASALGERALEGLGAALLRLGARRLAQGDTDDLAGLVPEYVTLPRGIERESGAVTWSHDPR